MTGDIEQRLQELAQAAAVCSDCRLSEGRTQAVFADGLPSADLMFIGEGPGFHEDQQGVPFVGAAGNLLDQVLSQVGLRRADTYIANVVKCRPPNNRDPRPDEIEACKHFLIDQIKLVDPLVIMTLGNFSTKLLLKTTVGITRMRGQQFSKWGKVIIPTFHPAAVLRAGPNMAEVLRSDLELAVNTMEEARRSGPPDTGKAVEMETPADQMGLFG